MVVNSCGLEHKSAFRCYVDNRVLVTPAERTLPGVCCGICRYRQ